MSLKEFHLIFISIVSLLFLGLTIYAVFNEFHIVATAFFALLTLVTPYYGWKFRSKIQKIESQF